MKHVAETKFVGQFFEAVRPLVDRGARMIDATAFLVLAGRLAGAAGELFPEILVTQLLIY